MIRLATLLAAVALLVSCGPATTTEGTGSFTIPDGLKDCKFFYLDEGGFAGHKMRVIRCPNSSTSTTYKVGKTMQHTITIDGVTYERKE